MFNIWKWFHESLIYIVSWMQSTRNSLLLRVRLEKIDETCYVWKRIWGRFTVIASRKLWIYFFTNSHESCIAYCVVTLYSNLILLWCSPYTNWKEGGRDFTWMSLPFEIKIYKKSNLTIDSTFSLIQI